MYNRYWKDLIFTKQKLSILLILASLASELSKEISISAIFGLVRVCYKCIGLTTNFILADQMAKIYFCIHTLIPAIVQ